MLGGWGEIDGKVEDGVDGEEEDANAPVARVLCHNLRH